MHRTQFGKKPAVKMRACVLVRRSGLQFGPERTMAGSAGRQQATAARRSPPAPLARIAVTNHPKSSLHRRQQRDQKRCDSNARKINQPPSENG
jgi:hypothetical protein